MTYKHIGGKPGFLPLPSGETRNITVNGTIRPYDGRDPNSKYAPAGGTPGSQGVVSVGTQTSSGADSNSNRSGEG
jgi:hypothetical protein